MSAFIHLNSIFNSFTSCIIFVFIHVNMRMFGNNEYEARMFPGLAVWFSPAFSCFFFQLRPCHCLNNMLWKFERSLHAPPHMLHARPTWCWIAGMHCLHHPHEQSVAPWNSFVHCGWQNPSCIIIFQRAMGCLQVICFHESFNPSDALCWLLKYILSFIVVIKYFIK